MRKPDFSNRFSPLAAYLLAPGEATTDRSGNGYTLTAVGSPGAARGYPGSNKAGLYLSTSNYYLQGHADWQTLGSVTMECLISLPVPSSPLSLAARQHSPAGDPCMWGFYVASDRTLRQYFHTASAVDHNTGGRAPVLEYAHLVLVRDVPNLMAYSYVNGALVGSAGIPTPTASSTSTTTILGRAVPGNPSNAAWQYASFYMDALSADQARYLAHLRLGGFA